MRTRSRWRSGSKCDSAHENDDGTNANNGTNDADGTGVVSGDEENANGLSDALTETAFEYLLGTFDSSAQAAANPSYFNVQ